MPAHAAVGGLGPVDRAVRPGLQRGPVDGQAVERRLERLEAVAPRREGADVLAVPEEVGIDLGHPDGQAAARRDVGRRRRGRRRLGGRRRRRGRRRLVVVTAAGPQGDGGGQQGRRDRERALDRGHLFVLRDAEGRAAAAGGDDVRVVDLEARRPAATRRSRWWSRRRRAGSGCRRAGAARCARRSRRRPSARRRRAGTGSPSIHRPARRRAGRRWLVEPLRAQELADLLGARSP